MINDLKVPNVPTWKYVDDTSVAETVQKGTLSDAQAAVTSVEAWSHAKTTCNSILENVKNS
jgi:hypothetical protein